MHCLKRTAMPVLATTKSSKNTATNIAQNFVILNISKDSDKKFSISLGTKLKRT